MLRLNCLIIIFFVSCQSETKLITPIVEVGMTLNEAKAVFAKYGATYEGPSSVLFPSRDNERMMGQFYNLRDNTTICLYLSLSVKPEDADKNSAKLDFGPSEIFSIDIGEKGKGYLGKSQWSQTARSSAFVDIDR